MFDCGTACNNYVTTGMDNKVTYSLRSGSNKYCVYSMLYSVFYIVIIHENLTTNAKYEIIMMKDEKCLLCKRCD